MSEERKKEIICILCPLGCRGTVNLDEKGKVGQAENYRCKKGREHAMIEGSTPMRVLTGTVLVDSTRRILLPVRTDRPVPRDILMECARLLCRIKLKAPVEIGEIIVPDIMGSGASVVSSARLES